MTAGNPGETSKTGQPRRALGVDLRRHGARDGAAAEAETTARLPRPNNRQNAHLLWIGFLAGCRHGDLAVRAAGAADRLAGGASGENKRRPFAIIAGLVLTSPSSRLFGTWFLQRLGLPDDLLRNIGIGILFLVAVDAARAPAGELIEAPLAR